MALAILPSGLAAFPAGDPTVEGGAFSSGSPRVKRVLLLQGPAGPFFSDLRSELEAQGYYVQRVLFNGGDKLFSRTKRSIRFSGTEEDWREWLHWKFTISPPNILVLFGSMRRIHSIARQVSDSFGIPVISLEEGYLRSGYITCEVGGNNRFSPRCNWRPRRISHLRPMSYSPVRTSAWCQGYWSFIYYSARNLFSTKEDELLFHRKREPSLRMAFGWAAHSALNWARQLGERHILRRLLKRYAGRFFLVPLQVPFDSQLQFAARGWTSDALIEEALQSLKTASQDKVLMFKMHPLDREGRKVGRTIMKRAQELDLAERVFLIHTGKIGRITKKAAGMMVINSTSALSALRHRTPVLVLGDAIFRHPEVVTVGETRDDIARFMLAPSVRPSATVREFLDMVRLTALVPGDFYTARGRRVAVLGVVQKVAQVLKARLNYVKAAE